jgi:hypothetical protein
MVRVPGSSPSTARFGRVTNANERPDERASNANPNADAEAIERRERMRKLGKLSGAARRRKAKQPEPASGDDVEALRLEAVEALRVMMRSNTPTSVTRAASTLMRELERREKREPAKREERHGYLELSPEETVGVVDQMEKMGLVVTAQARCESCGGRGRLVTLCDECAREGVDPDAA